MKKNKSFSNFISEGGLWDNIHKRRKKGLPPKKPGDKGYPKTLDIEGTEGYVSNAQRAAVWANRADGGKGHPDNKKKKKSKKEAYEPITTKRQQALAKAAAEPRKKVSLPKAPWEKDTNVTYDKNGKVVKEASKEGAIKIIKNKDNMAQVQRMTKGKFVNHGKPYKSAKDAEKVRSSGQHSMQFDSPAKKKPVSQMSSAEKKAHDERRKAYKDFQKSKRNQTEGAMKRMSTGDGMDTYRKKPAEVKDINKALMKKRNNPDEKDKDVKKINKSLADMRGEAFSARAIVKKPRAGDGKPMHTAPGAHGAEHKAAVKKYIKGMKSRRPGTTDNKDSKKDSKLPRQMKDPKKDAMVSKNGKVKVIDKDLEKAHLARGYVRAEDTISKELFMKEAKKMMVTRPGSNRPIEITVDQWPSFKMRGYHHAEQNENMRLINKMKKASPAAKKALEAPSRVGLTIDDVRKATEKAKKRQEKERKATGKTSTSTTDLASRKEDVNPNCECEDCQCNPCECGDWRADMGPGAGGIPTNQAEKLGEAKKVKMCEDCGCKYGNIDPDCDCPNDGSDPMGEHWTLEPYTEALDMKQRLARGRSARKNKSKLAMGRKKAGRRIASMKVLKKRARRAARKTLTKRLTKGIAKSDLTVSRKREIEKRLDTKTFVTKANKLVKRTIKDIRKKEIARKRK